MRDETAFSVPVIFSFGLKQPTRLHVIKSKFLPMKKLTLSLMVLLLGAGLAAAQTPALVNLSTRGMIGPGTGSLLAGFVVSGNASKSVLLRGIGPGLGA